MAVVWKAMTHAELAQILAAGLIGGAVGWLLSDIRYIRHYLQRITEMITNGPSMNNTKQVRPEIVSDEHLDFLDKLRESGVTNMFGAGQFLVRKFRVSRPESHKILGYWMDTFSERHPKS